MTLASCDKVLVPVLFAKLTIQLPVNVPGETEDDGPLTWAFATHVRDLNEVSDFGFSLMLLWL